MKKYEPLGNFLADVPAATGSVTLSFGEIEHIIGAQLPPSALMHRAWWANQEGGSRAPHWRAAGFKVDGVNQPDRTVSFRRVLNLSHPSIQVITDAIELRASDFEFGRLQEIRKSLKRRQRRSRTIFKPTTIHDNYAFHYGGRTELQFNIGFEKENDVRTLRHGLAISLKRGPSINVIDESILNRIDRLNEYLELHADQLPDFQMYNSWYNRKDRTDFPTLRPVPTEAVDLDAFIFLGRRQSADQVDVEFILRDFDRLLPMYVFVEGTGDPPASHEATQHEFVPGLTRKKSSTKVTLTERKLNKTLRHNDIQHALGQFLVERHGEDAVCDEYSIVNRNKVDVAVLEDDELTYYEIKVGVTARHCLRQAIGQLLEYSYWPQSRPAARLIVVGEPALDDPADEYLAELRAMFGVPIYYRQFDMKQSRMVDG